MTQTVRDPSYGRDAEAARLSLCQRRIWLQEQIGGAPGATHSCLTSLLTGPLDPALLQDALSDVVRRHQVLRWVYRAGGGEPVPALDPGMPTIDQVDLRDAPATDRVRLARQLVAERNLRTFDLADEVPIRAVLIRTGDAEHVLSFTMHRIGFDDRSAGILATELSECYSARRRGRSARLPELPVDYAEFARWQRAKGAAAEPDRAYWKARLGGVAHVLDLPCDRPRPLTPAYRAGAVPLDFDPGTASALRAGGTAATRTTMLATFAALLHRCTGAPDVIVAVPVERRTAPGADRLIGCFSDVAPVRVDLAGDPSLDELVDRVGAAAEAATAHSGMSFEQIVEAVSPRRIPGQPLAQVMFTLRQGGEFGLDLDGVRCVPLEETHRGGQLDLAADLGATLSGRFEFNQELFDPATVARLAQQWRVLLAEWLARPAERLSRLPVLTREDERRVLYEWNATVRDVPGQRLDELFLEVAERHPDRVALISGEHRWTYGWLAERSAALAAHLHRLGVAYEEPVAIGLPRSAAYFVAVLAVLRCRATFLALDPSYPEHRLSYMVADSGARILLTERDLVGQLPADGLRTVYVGDVTDDAPAPELPATPAASVAYLIYTSGSSGVPKAVMGTHAATVNRLAWMWSEYPFAPREVCCQKASLCFGDSIWETFGGLLRGVPTLVLSDTEVRNPDQFVDALAAAAVTRCTLVPSMLWLLVDRTDVPEKLSRLRIAVSSGEALETELARRFRRVLPDCTLLNLYGSSELAADVTGWDCAAPSDGPGVPIGRPIANTSVFVLDPALRPVPVGVAGEALVGGAGLARGYAGRPGMTAERFIPNPYGRGRLYRTGDRCRWRADGVLEYLGRLDDQVKVRGMRIEPAEVEAMVARHPGVAKCAAVARSFGPGDVRLVCFVVPAPDRTVTGTVLRRFTRGQLPEFMVPSMFVTVPELPMTPSGKVDRRSLALPRAATGGAELSGSDLERRVAEVWAEALEVDRVGLRDNFFELGGDSVRMMHLASRLAALLNRPVSLGTLYVNQSVEEFCQALPADDSR